MEWDTPFDLVRLSSIEEGENLANRVRTAWKIGGDPIPDMIELLEEHGVKVVVIDLPENVSGLTCLIGRLGNKLPVPVIVVNASHNIERRRITLAHELVHQVMDPSSPVDQEKAAMHFAGAFLMPAEHLKEEAGQRRHSFGYRELMELKHLYRVSAAAVLVRLKQINIISHSTMIHIFRTTGRGWRKKEPLPINDNTIETALRFERLCFRALSENLISLAKAAELLGKTGNEVRHEVKGPMSGAGAG